MTRRLARWIISAVAVATSGLAAFLGYSLISSGLALSKGKAVYDQQCAGCHGANLEGAPTWQERLPDGRWPPPPHDKTGHPWHHGDDLLFEIVKNGPQSVLGPAYQTDMPAFGAVLSDREIHRVLAYIKSTWPSEERDYQALMSLPPVERLIRAQQP